MTRPPIEETSSWQDEAVSDGYAEPHGQKDALSGNLPKRQLQKKTVPREITSNGTAITK